MVKALIDHPIAAALFFFAGVTYDSLTLTRIDRLQDNLVLLLYLAALGVLTVLAARAEPLAGSQPARGQPLYRVGIQFLLGGLFSAYAIFYSRSASLTTAGIFALVLVGLLVGNEFLRDRLSNLRLLLGLYSLASFSFFTFFIPVLAGLMNTAVFLVGARLSLGLTLMLTWLIHRGRRERGSSRILRASLPAMGVIGTLVAFYFLNWIPPVPLSLQFGGIYHGVSREDGIYRLAYESRPWYRIWERSDDPFHGEGPVYCFTAVFAPVDLTSTVYHRWQRRPVEGEGKAKNYVTTDRIGFPISGGRDAGYRGFTVKQRVTPGDWRVDVETADGRIIGRVSFRVERAPETQPAL